PNTVLGPIILILSIVGIFSARNMIFDLWIGLGIGFAFYFLGKLGFSAPSFILAFILGPIIEKSLRRTLTISDGSYAVFITRIYSLVLILIIAAIIAISIFNWIKRKRKARLAVGEG